MKYSIHPASSSRTAALSGTTLSLALGLAFALAPAASPAHDGHSPPPQASERARPNTPEIRIEGEVEVLVEDYAEHARTRYFVRSGGRAVELHFRGRAPELQTGARVSVRGRPYTDEVAELDVENGEAVTTTSTSSTTSTAELANTLGEQRTLVMLVNFQDLATQPIARNDAHTLVFGTVSDYFRENSYGQTWLRGDTTGWLTLPVSSTSCNSSQIATEADKRAAAAGYNLANYTRLVYMFPKNACAWAGLGTVGGNPSRAWINNNFSLHTVSHEIGHNFGLYHANALDCDAGSLTGTCTTVTYGDPIDTMGARAGHYGAFNKHRMGWLNNGIAPPIATATSSGRYYIDAYAANTLAPKALQIPRGTDSSGRKLHYYVEYRRPTGFDSVLSGVGNLTAGVIVRQATQSNGNSSLFVDTTPNSDSRFSRDMADGALEPGKRFTDDNAGVTVTLAWADGQTAAVDVAFGSSGGGSDPTPEPTPTCTTASPTFSLSGGASEVLAGQGTSYTVTLKNNDSSACSGSTFDLARSLPSGWSGSFAASKLSVSPGASAITTLSVTTTENTSSGSYSIASSASRSSGGGAQATSSLKVSQPASTTVAKVGAISLSKTSRGKNVSTIAIATIVDSNGKPIGSASVTGCFSGAASGCSTTSSDGVGQASFSTGNYRGGSVTFCVTSVTGSNVGSFDASNNCKSN